MLSRSSGGIQIAGCGLKAVRDARAVRERKHTNSLSDFSAQAVVGGAAIRPRASYALRAAMAARAASATFSACSGSWTHDSQQNPRSSWNAAGSSDSLQKEQASRSNGGGLPSWPAWDDSAPIANISATPSLAHAPDDSFVGCSFFREHWDYYSSCLPPTEAEATQ